MLEKWLFNGMFDASAGGDSELDAVKAYVCTVLMRRSFHFLTRYHSVQ